MSVQSVSSFPKRWIILVVVMALLLATIAILSQYRAAPSDHVYTVSEALTKRTELNGQRITVRGYSLFEYAQTLLLCQPRRCDCNQTYTRYLLLVDADTIAASQLGPINTEQLIVVDMLDCQGDECSLTCRPINPKTTNELELTGRFHYDPTTSVYPTLDSVELDLAREKIGGVWQPVKTGTFTIPLRQP